MDRMQEPGSAVSDRRAASEPPTRPVSFEALFSGELITGIDEFVYELGPFESGEYYFQDDEHPEANGVLVVE
jgi:hypothetical protein